jgi:hypothetical protein
MPNHHRRDSYQSVIVHVAPHCKATVIFILFDEKAQQELEESQSPQQSTTVISLGGVSEPPPSFSPFIAAMRMLPKTNSSLHGD